MHTFIRRYNFGSVTYIINHEDESKLDEHKYIDYEYLRLFAEEGANHKVRITMSIICLSLLLALSVLNGIALSNEIYVGAVANTIATIFEALFIISSFGLIIFCGCCFDDDSNIRKIEALYPMTEPGKLQFEQAKKEYEAQEKEKNDKKADQLITTYDTLDSNMKREKKIEIISDIIKNMEK